MIFDEFITQFKRLSGAKNETDVGKILGFAQSTFAQRKKTGSIPYREAVLWAQKNQKSLDDLFKIRPKISEQSEYEEKLADIFDHADPETKGFIKGAIEIAHSKFATNKKGA